MCVDRYPCWTLEEVMLGMKIAFEDIMAAARKKGGSWSCLSVESNPIDEQSGMSPITQIFP
jgi:hypothetical protein